MNTLSTIQASFATKRAEQASLPERIAEARERLAEELTDLERAKSELASISTLYPAQMLASLQDNPEPVSYTHLDVYKRQETMSPPAAFRLA